MARGSHRESKNAPSQRALRAGEVIRHATVSTSLLFIPTLAKAEVCDKAIWWDWRREDGPVWLFGSGVPFTFILLIAGLVLVIAKKLWWLGYILSALTLINAAAIYFLDVLPAHDIYLAELREGCRSKLTDIADVSLFAAFACAFLGFGYFAHRSVRSRSQMKIS